jgi:uncharacterized protein (TIGR02271 family)
MTNVIPVVEETLSVDKIVVETGAAVRVHKRVEEFTTTAEQTLLRDQYEVMRVPVDRVVDQAPAVREEGDSIVVSVVEERLVTTKVLVLVEEIRLTRREVAAVAEHTMTLSREIATVERRESDSDEWKPV